MKFCPLPLILNRGETRLPLTATHVYVSVASPWRPGLFPGAPPAGAHVSHSVHVGMRRSRPQNEAQGLSTAHRPRGEGPGTTGLRGGGVREMRGPGAVGRGCGGWGRGARGGVARVPGGPGGNGLGAAGLGDEGPGALGPGGWGPGG